MKNYVKYQFKRALLPFGVIAFAGLLIYVLPLLIPSSYNFASYVEDMEMYLMVGLTAACILLPVWAFRYKMNRRSTDLYFSLPIKRHKLLLTNFLSGFAAIVAAYTVVFWLGFIVIAVKAPQYEVDFALINMLWLYLVSLPLSYVVYSVYSFAYTRANNVIDGLIFMVFATCALMMVALLFYFLIVTQEVYYYEGENGVNSFLIDVHYVNFWNYMPFMPLGEFTSFFSRKAVGKTPYYFNTPLGTGDINIIVSTVLFALLAAACTAGLVLLEKKNKSEDCEQNSDSIFGYKVMIPLHEAVLLAAGLNSGSIVIVLIVVAVGYFLTAIWKRSFKIGWKAFGIYAASVAAGFVLGVLIELLF